MKSGNFASPPYNWFDFRCIHEGLWDLRPALAKNESCWELKEISNKLGRHLKKSHFSEVKANPP